jgi:hypothetical protein
VGLSLWEKEQCTAPERSSPKATKKFIPSMIVGGTDFGRHPLELYPMKLRNKIKEIEKHYVD